MDSIRKNVLQAELSICEAIKLKYIVLWNSSAKLCANIKTAKPEGCTNPTAIFQNESTKNAFNASDVIVFVTDGKIDNSSVTQVNKKKRCESGSSAVDLKKFNQPLSL